MPKHIAIYLFIALFTAAALFLFARSQLKSKMNQNSVVIKFKDGAYNPKNVTIKVNQTITFKNISSGLIWPASNIHPTHQIYPEFDPQKPIKSGGSWSFTFTKIGIFKYHDHLQPQISGEIIVQ